MGLHDDHRKRVRAAFLEKGADALDDVHLLELYLFYTNPRADVNPLAIRLIDRFGSLDGVFSAAFEELCSVSGVGENTAVLLMLLKPLYRRAAMSAADGEQMIHSSDEAAGYLAPYFFGIPYETVYLLCLTTAGRVLRCVNLGSGTVNSAEFAPSDAVSAAVAARASCAVLAHNHVNGLAEPSQEDVIATRMTAEAMRNSGILLLDHLIFAGEESCSLKARGLYDFSAE